MTYILRQTRCGYRVVEKRGVSISEQKDLFHKDLDEGLAMRYVELLADADASGCFAIDRLVAIRGQDRKWHIIDEAGRVARSVTSAGFALVSMTNPLSRMCCNTSPVSPTWKPLIIFVKELELAFTS